MAEFRVTWASGKVTSVVQSDCDTVDQFINTAFGRGIRVSDVGIKVELIAPAALAPVVQQKPAAATKLKPQPTTGKA